MKKYLILYFVCLHSTTLLAQKASIELASQHNLVRKDSTIPPKKLRQPNLPMYGLDQYETNVEDEQFLKACEQNFGTRQEASTFFAARAWEYLAEGQTDTAMHRFNLAWLLYPESIDSYWGWGVLAYQQSKWENAIKYLEKGLALKPNNVTLMVDLATSYIRCYQDRENKEDLQTAFSLLNRAIEIEPTFANAYMKLSLAEYAKGETDKAWWSFHKGYELAPDEADIDYLQKLLTKQQDPKGVFKE